ncbi:MAG: imidazole glycerol phosphate synthase subunit HisH [Alphaproteobacteria bacterium]|nr:imidazole glycerol phosphate synthase subunit HisH [Alphaproteobacteria bacterium]
MTRRRIGVVDYGAGNLFSVERGLLAAGCAPTFVSRPEQLADIDAVVLPGVGAFAKGMAMLAGHGMDEALVGFARAGKPLMGVCLGMQLLMTASREFGLRRGLDLIEGEVVAMTPEKGAPVPNVGWSEIRLERPAAGTPFAAVVTGTDFYFVHSFHCVPANAEAVVATIRHGTTRVAAIVSRDNVHGCQFHPEVSDRAGLAIYRLFSNPDTGVDQR